MKKRSKVLLITVFFLVLGGVFYIKTIPSYNIENNDKTGTIVKKLVDKVNEVNGNKVEEDEPVIIEEEPKSEEERKVRVAKETMAEQQYFEALFAVKNMPEGQEKQELVKELEAVKPEIESKEKVKLEVFEESPEDSFLFTYWSREAAEDSIKRYYEEITEKAKRNPDGGWGEANANGYIVGENNDIGGWDILVREGKDGRVLYEGVILTKDGQPVLSDLSQAIRDKLTE